MRSLLAWIWTKPLARKAVTALVMAGLTIVAFYWGRMGGATVDAQQVQPRPGGLAMNTTPVQQPQSDYSRRVVAYIYENTPITREDLGEYLITRLGHERIEFLINRRILENACQAKGIYVTDLEVEAQFKDELKMFGLMSAQEFSNQVLRRFNKSLYEYKEDVIRQKLLLAKLCRPMITVTQEDLTKAYEARYGEKVQCRVIAFAKGDRHMSDVYSKISKSEAEFADYAKKQFMPAFAEKGGVIDPIHKHYGDPNIEKAAFSLQPGQVTPLMEMPDGNSVVLKCDKILPKDATKSFDSVRLDLHKEMTEVKLSQKITEYMIELRKQANPRVLITEQIRQEELERRVLRNLGSAHPATPRPTGPSGN